VQKRIIGLFDVAYTNESGLSELVDNAQDVLKGQEIVREKGLMTRFLQEVVKENGNAAYGEESVRKNLENGSVDILLLSSRLRKSRVKLRCVNCLYHREVTVPSGPKEEGAVVEVGGCPSCSTPLVKEEEDLIEELTHLAVNSGSTVEFITDDFEEGSILYNAFGGVAALLRFRTGY